MADVDFLHHENPPTWAGVEPATLGAEGQRQTNLATQTAVLNPDFIIKPHVLTIGGIPCHSGFTPLTEVSSLRAVYTKEALQLQIHFLVDWKYTQIYNPQRRLRILAERFRKDSSQLLELHLLNS
ncbi:hypothetical protein TNCV_2309641 [Trichonephila clavipes]|nr:hypothetical protein TNCV_2309641 [Trichonephila clavipes]